MLIDPGVVRRLAAAVVGHAAELRAGQTIQRPALGAVLAGRVRAIERALALAPVEAPRCPLASADQATPWLSISPPRGE